MKKLNRIFCLLLSVMALNALQTRVFAQTCSPTPRKGVATYIKAGSNANSIDALNLRWWYDWSPNQRNYGAGYTGSATYIPDFWDATGTNLLPLSGVAAATAAPWVFTFNEPDVSNQSNMTSSQAVSAWPTVVSDAGSRSIGAPAIAIYGDGWLDPFMAGVSKRPNFLALHEYPEGNGTSLATQVATFKNYILKVHNAYPDLPIILNEFALVNRNTWTGSGVSTSEQIAFMQAMVPWLEAQSFVQGYSWYAAYLGYYNSDLLKSDGSLTPLGQTYSGLGCVGTATTPPSPANYNAGYLTSTGFTAYWQSVSGANQYTIYLYDTNYNLQNTYFVANVTSYPINDLASSTSYRYCVTAGNSAGISTCAPSTAVTTYAAGGSLPSAPTTQAATNITTTGFTATLTPVSGATNYVVYQFTDALNLITSYTAGNTSSLAITNLAGSTQYNYCVAAGNSTGFSACANSASVTTH